MLTVTELILRIHQETGHLTSPQVVTGWMKKGLCNIVLPHERVGGKVRIKWADYRAWQKRVNKAKGGKRLRGKRSIVAA